MVVERWGSIPDVHFFERSYQSFCYKMQFLNIVGLNLSDGGRSCSLHEVCGSSLAVGNVLVIKRIFDSKGNLCLGAFKESAWLVSYLGNCCDSTFAYINMMNITLALARLKY
jgi:hypothetical protein